MGMLQVRMDDKLLKTLDGRAIECGLDRSSYVKLVLTISKITSEVVRQCTDKDGKKEIVYDNVLHPVNDNVVQQSINPKVEALKSNPKLAKLIAEGMLGVGVGLVPPVNNEGDDTPTGEEGELTDEQLEYKEKYKDEDPVAKWERLHDINEAENSFCSAYEIDDKGLLSRQQKEWVKKNVVAINEGTILWPE